MDWQQVFSADSFNQYVVPWAINIVFALGIFIVGRWVVSGLTGVLRRLLIKAKMDDILVDFICTIARAALLLFVIIAALDQFGVDTTSLIALLGAAGLAVGLAMQGSLANFAAGVMLIVFHPFRAGDFIEAGGTSGTVEKISIFSTVMRTPDNREVIVPNGSIYGSNIVNFSARDTRRIDLVFGIGYGDDIRKARDIIFDILGQDERILKDPEPVVAVGELGASSVDFVVRPWVATADYWNVRWDLLEKIKLAFDANGVSIPFPQRDVHLYQQAGEAAD
jgi:small conductance mechanosensitive channel